MFALLVSLSIHIDTYVYPWVNSCVRDKSRKRHNSYQSTLLIVFCNCLLSVATINCHLFYIVFSSPVLIVHIVLFVEYCNVLICLKASPHQYKYIYSRLCFCRFFVLVTVVVACHVTPVPTTIQRNK